MASKLKDIHVAILQALDIVEVSWFPCSVAWMFGALLQDYQKDVVPIFKKVWVRLRSFGEIYSECHRGVFNKLSNVRFWKTSVVFSNLPWNSAPSMSCLL